MKPRIVDYLDHLFNVSFFSYIVPDPAFVYAAMIGIVAWLFITRSGRAGLSKYHAAGLATWAAVGGLMGTRLFYLIQNIPLVTHNPAMLLEINGATVSFGAYLGGMAGLFSYAKFYHLSSSSFLYLDVLAPIIGLGIMLGRIGCFLNGDDFGKLSNAPWAVRYPGDSYPFIDHVQRGWINPSQSLSLPVHPVQLYGSIKGLILFMVFTWLWKKDIFKPGVLFLLFWMAYAVCRFSVEFFRGDDNRGWVGTLSTGQFMSVCIFAACGFILLRLGLTNKVVISRV